MPELPLTDLIRDPRGHDIVRNMLLELDWHIKTDVNASLCRKPNCLGVFPSIAFDNSGQPKICESSCIYLVLNRRSRNSSSDATDSSSVLQLSFAKPNPFFS